MPARNPRVGKSDVNQRQKSRSPSKHHLKPRVSTMAALDDAHDQRSPSPTAKIKEGCEKCGLGHRLLQQDHWLLRGPAGTPGTRQGAWQDLAGGEERCGQIYKACAIDPEGDHVGRACQCGSVCGASRSGLVCRKSTSRGVASTPGSLEDGAERGLATAPSTAHRHS